MLGSAEPWIGASLVSADGMAVDGRLDNPLSIREIHESIGPGDGVSISVQHRLIGPLRLRGEASRTRHPVRVTEGPTGGSATVDEVMGLASLPLGLIARPGFGAGVHLELGYGSRSWSGYHEFWGPPALASCDRCDPPDRRDRALGGRSRAL